MKSVENNKSKDSSNENENNKHKMKKFELIFIKPIIVSAVSIEDAMSQVDSGEIVRAGFMVNHDGVQYNFSEVPDFELKEIISGVKRDLRFKIMIPKINSLIVEKIEDETPDKLGYQSYNIIEIRNDVEKQN